MSYYLDTYYILISLIAGGLIFGTVLAIVLLTADWANTGFGWENKKRSLFTTLSILVAAISFYLVLVPVPDYLNDGHFKNIYLVQKNDAVRLVVFFQREDEPSGFSEVYSHRIKSFDLQTGEASGRLTLTNRHVSNDFAIYGPFNEHAWGYSAKEGLLFLDMFDAQVLADQQSVLSQNPELGKEVRITKGPTNYWFDPVTYGLYLSAASGDIFRLNPDLNATPTSSIDYSKEIHNKETCAVCLQEARFIDVKNSRAGWSVNKTQKQILQFRNESGKIMSTIDIDTFFDDNRFLYAAARLKDEVWLFTSMENYRLSAIRTEASTGKIIGVVDYF